MPIIGVGVDIMEIGRFAASLANRPRLAERCFTPAEAAYCASRAFPPQHFAARFAAKEAVMKALGVGLGACELSDIEVVRDEDSGAPDLRLHGKAAVLAEERGVTAWRISLTHTDTAAHAIVIAV